MKRSRIIPLLFVPFIFYLNGFAQEKKFDFELSGGYLSQINTPKSASPAQYGGFIGIGVFKESKLGRLNFNLDLNYLSEDSTKELIINNYQGFSLKGQANYLVKTFVIGESFLYLGPGAAVHQPLNANGDYNGPSMGANFKVLFPVKISDFSFFINYDFDYIISQGYIRNGIGISFWP